MKKLILILLLLLPSLTFAQSYRTKSTRQYQNTLGMSMSYTGKVYHQSIYATRYFTDKGFFTSSFDVGLLKYNKQSGWDNFAGIGVGMDMHWYKPLKIYGEVGIRQTHIEDNVQYNLGGNGGIMLDIHPRIQIRTEIDMLNWITSKNGGKVVFGAGLGIRF